MKKHKNIIDLSAIPKGSILHSIKISFTDLYDMGGATIDFMIPAKTAKTKGKIRFVEEV